VTRAILAIALALTSGAAVAVTADEHRTASLIVEGTNAFRRAQGLHDVTPEAQLTRAATEFAGYMARTARYGHEADGRDPAERARAHGYDYCVVLENIAYHYDSRGLATEALAHKSVEGWKASPPHRKNMLDARVTHTGVAVARGANGYYYGVQMFGLPRSAAIRFEVRNESQADVRYRVGEQAYTVPARSVRTHEVCSREPVRFEGLRPPERSEARAGDRFLVPAEGRRVTLQRR
jgi:uncharacterized protein YkwD